MKRMTAAVVGVVMLMGCGVAMAGQWLTPGWGEGKEPKFDKVPLFWFEVTETPLVYRTVVDVPAECDRATAMLRTGRYAYVCVDGKQVFAWAERAADKQKNDPGDPADPKKARELDLSAYLTPGKHVLTVSAPREGFVLDGGLYSGVKRLGALGSDEKWTVTKFMPTAIVEDQPIMKLAYDGQAVKGQLMGDASAAGPVKAGETWTADENALAKAYHAEFVKHARQELGEAVWRLELLSKKGIYIIDSAAYGWGGASRADAAAVAKAAELLAGMGAMGQAIDGIAGKSVDTSEALAAVAPDMARLTRELTALGQGVEQVSQAAMQADEAKAIELARQATGLAELDRAKLEAAIGHPLNKLNESRYDRLGWMPYTALTDSQVGTWGIRINPVTQPTKVRAPNRWLFATDPGNAGERELRWTIGYNVEGQMDRMDVPKNWTQVDKYKSYKGIAWYRARIEIPDQWAGNEVVLTLSVGGQEKLWINDQDVTKFGAGEMDARGVARRTYKLPPSVVAYGGENFVAVKIDAQGDQRGLVGAVEASCPTLDGPEGKSTPATEVLSTPLSPCVVLTPKTEVLQIHHTGQVKLMLPGDNAAGRAGYLAQGDGKLKANWAMLWLAPQTAAGVERPILLVFQANPVSIACEQGVTKVTFAKAGERVIAVRPWAKADPTKAGDKFDLQGAVAMWSRAALAVPVNYMNITKVLQKGEPWENMSVDKMPKGPVLGHTVIYDYLVTRDEWNTEAMKLAPLPALCSYGMDTKFRNLKLDQGDRIQVLQDGGLAAAYRGMKDADRVSYSYDVEAWPRFVGFTSWMFGGTDAGVPGNKRELELMAAIGANTYRPQHNWSNQLPPEWFRQGNKTRVVITADYCNAVGINYMNNIEQTLDRGRAVRDNYDQWVQRTLFPHYERLVPQVASRPFWAVSWDLVNEPFDHQAVKYNPTMKELTRRLRQVDKTHVCYIEPCQAWGAIQQLRLIEPTGDPLTMYSFHDYNFRLEKDAHWPTMQQDMSNICQMWWPAFEFAVKYGYGMHCGEFGGFYPPTDDALGQKTLMNDLFRIFDQFGMHSNYYPGRGVFQRLADGSQRPTNVVRVYREYFRRPDFNMYYGRWQGEPAVPAASN